MNTSELLDLSMDFDGVLSTDSEYTRRRARHLAWAQEIVDEVCDERPFSWRMTSTTVTFTAGVNAADLPANFVELGPTGGLWDASVSPARKLDEQSPQIVQGLQIQTNAISIHSCFSIFAVDATPVQQLQIGRNGQNQSFTLWYIQSPPTLADATTSSGLEYIPVQYHRTVVLAGLKAKIMRANEDSRADTTYEGIYKRGRERMVIIEFGRKSTIQQLPRAISPGRFSGWWRH